MDVIKSLLGNDHSLFAILLLIGATVLAATGKMSVADWQTYSMVVFGIYGGTTSALGVADAIKAKASPTAAAVVAAVTAAAAAAAPAPAEAPKA